MLHKTPPQCPTTLYILDVQNNFIEADTARVMIPIGMRDSSSITSALDTLLGGY